MLFQTQIIERVTSNDRRYRAVPPPANLVKAREAERAYSDHVMEFARQRGDVDEAGNFDLSGLVLNQQLHDSDGAVVNDLTYMVNQRVVTEAQYKKDDERNWKTRHEGSTLILHELGQKLDVKDEEPKLVSVVDLDVYDADKRLISKRTFGSQADFLAFLDSHDEVEAREKREKKAGKLGQSLPVYLSTQHGNSVLPRGPLTGMGWSAERPTPTAELDANDRERVDIPLDEDGDVMEQVFSSREGLKLPGNSLVGLTMRVGDHVVQVTQDILRYTPANAGKQVMKTSDIDDGDVNRVFEVMEWDEHGRQVNLKALTYPADSLRKRLNSRKFTDIYWEIPRAEMRRGQEAWLGRQIMQRTNVGAPAGVLPEFARQPVAGNRHMSLEDAFEVLSSPDIADNDGGFEARLARLKKRAGFSGLTPSQAGPVERLDNTRIEESLERKVAETLRRTVMRYGATAVSNLAEQLRDEYIYASRMLGLPVPKEKESLSWALWAIAEERYYAHNPQDAEARRRADLGIKAGDPFSSRIPEARRKRQEIVDLAIGQMFVDTCMTPELTAGKPVNVVNRQTGGVETIRQPKLTFVLNEKLLVHDIQGFVEEEIHLMIDKIRQEKEADNEYRPPRDVLAALGRQLRRQFQR